MPSAFSPFRTPFAALAVGGVILATVAAVGAAEPAPTHANVSYGRHPHQRLDIYFPPGGRGPHPIVLWFGGIWRPARRPANLTFFGKANCAVIAVQTRTMTDAVEDKVSPPISYVAKDACRAVQFVRLNAAKWKLDPERIAVGGGSQGALPALFVACAGERADPRSRDPVERVSTKVTCAAAYRSQPSIDPKRMQEWVPGVEWGAPALGCGFAESLKRRKELLPIISRWSPDALLRRGAPPLYFENNWGLKRPESVKEKDYKVHSPAWALGFQKLAERAGVVCHVKYPGHPTEKYHDIWDFIVQELKRSPAKDKKFDAAGMSTMRLNESIELMKSIEKDMADHRYDDAARKRRDAMRKLRSAFSGMDETTAAKIHQARDLPPQMRKELLQSSDQGSPPGYEGLLKSYYKALSTAEK